METMCELRDRVKRGFTDWKEYGEVKAVYRGGLVLFNYTNGAQYARRWNWFERNSRGLILGRETGEIIARPFAKFFNWGERGQRSRGHIVEVTEKLDGSLGILYHWEGENRIATRGSFGGEQAVRATEILWDKGYRRIKAREKWTLLFEIIYPENRIVIDYGKREDLILLAARHKQTGIYIPFFPDLYELASEYGFSLPKVYQFNRVIDILEAKEQLGGDAEGWVVSFSDGQRFKFKGDRYLEIHRLLYHTSFKRVVEAVEANTLDSVIKDIPDEFLVQVKGWQVEIESKVAETVGRAEEAFADAPKGTRKEYALWVNKQHQSLATYLFLMLDGRDILPEVYKREF